MPDWYWTSFENTHLNVGPINNLTKHINVTRLVYSLKSSLFWVGGSIVIDCTYLTARFGLNVGLKSKFVVTQFPRIWQPKGIENRRFSIRSCDNLHLVIANNKTLDHSSIELGFYNPTLRQNITDVTSRYMQLQKWEDR